MSLCLYAPVCLYTPICPHTPVHQYVLRGFCMLWGVVIGPLTCWTLPLHLLLYGGASPSVYTPTHSWAPLCIGMFWRYLYVIWGFFLILGVFPICWGFWGASAHGMSICSFLYIFAVHYVSHFYHGYDYYSSNYSGIFWPVICFISDCCSFPDGFSSNRGSAWSGSATILDAKRFWRCYWLCLCATAVTSIFDAFSGLCQLCYGFSTGRFLFQS